MKAKMSGRKEVKPCASDVIWSQDLRYNDEEATLFNFLSSDCKQSFHDV